MKLIGEYCVIKLLAFYRVTRVTLLLLLLLVLLCFLDMCYFWSNNLNLCHLLTGVILWRHMLACTEAARL